jgi:hypothetical protein
VPVGAVWASTAPAGTHKSTAAAAAIRESVRI